MGVEREASFYSVNEIAVYIAMEARPDEKKILQSTTFREGARLRIPLKNHKNHRIFFITEITALPYVLCHNGGPKFSPYDAERDSCRQAMHFFPGGMEASNQSLNSGKKIPRKDSPRHK